MFGFSGGPHVIKLGGNGYKYVPGFFDTLAM